MIAIPKEDVSKILPAVEKVLENLGSGVKTMEVETSVGEEIRIATVLGYWTGNVARIDIKFRK